MEGTESSFEAGRMTRFSVVGGMGPVKTLWVVWDREKRIYIDSGSRDQMESLAQALNAAASNQDTKP